MLYFLSVVTKMQRTCAKCMRIAGGAGEHASQVVVLSNQNDFNYLFSNTLYAGNLVSVTKLHIFGAWFTEDDSRILFGVDSVFRNKQNVLEHLVIQNTDMNDNTNYVTNLTVGLIAHLIRHNRCNLKTLIFSNTGLNVAAAQLMVPTKYKNCTLTSLNLSNNKINDDSVKRIASVLSDQNCTLTSLNLSDNYFGVQGAIFLSHITDTNKTLTTLILSNNRIGSRGVAVLVNAFVQKGRLRNLGLSRTNVAPDAAPAIAYSLRTAADNCSLQNLDLSGNDFGCLGGALSNVPTNFKIHL